MLLAMHAATRGLALCACLVLLVQCAGVLDPSVLSPVPLWRWKRTLRPRERMLQCHCVRWMQPAACVRVPCTCARFVGMFVYSCRFCQAC